MLIIRLIGGLGNQIFQLIAVLLFAKKYGFKKIIIDDSALGNYDAKRKNELQNFFAFNKLDLKINFRKLKITKFRIPRILPLPFSKYPFISDKNFQKIYKNPNKMFLLLDGYFQECLTQDDFNQEIMILKEILNYKLQLNADGCIIHIRGGDFVKLGWHSITPKEYYVKAIETMQNKYKQNKFYIVTDDRNYSKTILDELNITYEFIGNSIYEDFKFIGSFNHRILSASTFALWASALGINENSIVIAPKYWTPNHERKIFLPNEIRVEF